MASAYWNQLMAVIAASGASGVAQPLRTISAYNLFPNTNLALSRDTLRGRYPLVIGSGDVSEIVLSLHNIRHGSTGIQGSGSTMQWNKITLEKGDASAHAPVTIGGGRSATLLSGESDIKCDPFLPSNFGLSKFTLGELYWIRYEIYFPAGSGNIPRINNRDTVLSGASTWSFNNSASVYSAIDATGPMAYVSGTVGGPAGNCMAPIALGRFVSGDPNTYVWTGNSISDGFSDTSTRGIAGPFHRAMFDTDLISNPIACLGMGCNGANAGSWTTSADRTLLTRYFDYVTRGFEEYGTNNISAASLATVFADTVALHGYMKARAIQKIMRTRLCPGTTSTDLWLTEANQTYTNAGWAPGGTADLLFSDPAYWPSRLGVPNGIDLLVDIFGATRGTDPSKWVTNGSTAQLSTPDGIHVKPAYQILAAAQVRAQMAAMG